MTDSKISTFEEEVGGRKLIIETGRLANQAGGSVTVRYGDTMVLATVTMSEGVRDDIDYFPLMVDYQEKLYATGKIKGSRFIKREGRPSDEAVLTGRLIDRSIRPLFPQHIVNDIQVVCEVLSVDEENDSAIPALIGASAAIAISNVPVQEIISAFRVGKVDGKFILNPTFEERKKSDLDLILSITENDKLIMIEGQSKEVSEEDVSEAIKLAKESSKSIIDLIKKAQKEIGKEKKDMPEPEVKPEITEAVKEMAEKKVEEILFMDKREERKKEIYKLSNGIVKELSEKFGKEEKANIKSTFVKILDNLVNSKILNEDKRIGDRAIDEIRPLSADIDILPRTHGSGLFQRGETQVLTATTLGGPSMEQIIDDMGEEYKKRYMHHYNFPPYSVGEVQPLRGPSRRDIGHGSLAEKALEAVLPSKEDFPYTIRLVSEVLSSNGSSSMASVCGSSLSLMAAGVPIKNACAGIAMGLIANDKGDYKILTDLQDLEDIDGGMDFKIAGTRDGITAIQMDTKTLGLTDDMIIDTLEKGKVARLQILDVMNKVIDKPKADLSKYAPRIINFKIDPEKIGDVIGPQGKIINEIIDATGVEIDIEDDGMVNITSVDSDKALEAREWIYNLVKEAKVGEIFDGKITRKMNFGIFVEVLPGKEGLVHISNLKVNGFQDAERDFNVGDKIKVKVMEIDDQRRINLALFKK
jgi:polyribonucleotide nucleotidyltransferase